MNWTLAVATFGGGFFAGALTGLVRWYLLGRQEAMTLARAEKAEAEVARLRIALVPIVGGLGVLSRSVELYLVERNEAREIATQIRDLCREEGFEAHEDEPWTLPWEKTP